MDAIVKYFYEEPFALEPLVSDTEPDARPRATLASLHALLAPSSYHRGYLAGRSTDESVGLTTVPSAAWVPGLLDALGAESGWVLDQTGALDPCTLAQRLGTLAGVEALFATDIPPDFALATQAALPDRRRALPAIRVLLDTGTAVLLPEPAHEGYDLTLFAPRPVKAALLAAWRAHPLSGVQRFVAPYQRMRSEHRFYFETWQLDALPDYVERA